MTTARNIAQVTTILTCVIFYTIPLSNFNAFALLTDRLYDDTKSVSIEVYFLKK